MVCRPSTGSRGFLLLPVDLRAWGREVEGEGGQGSRRLLGPQWTVLEHPSQESEGAIGRLRAKGVVLEAAAWAAPGVLGRQGLSASRQPSWWLGVFTGVTAGASVGH